MPLSLGGESGYWRAVRTWRARPMFGYAAAVLFVGLATAARILLEGILPPGLPYITFYPAVVATAVVGGLGPGVLCLVGSTLVAWLLFLGPAWSFSVDPGDVASLLLFVATSTLTLAVVVALNVVVDRYSELASNTRTVIDHLPVGILVADESGRITYINASAESLFGFSAADIAGKAVETLIPPVHRTKHANLRAGFMASPRSRMMGQGSDLKGRRRDGSEFPVEVGLTPVYRRRHLAGVLATIVDISARKAEEEQRELMSRELHHRMRNLLAMVRAVVARSLTGQTSVDAAREVIEGRLNAFGHSFASLASGKVQGTALKQILADELKAFSDRVSVTGPDIVLSPDVVQDFALIVHELATNAVKHGSLSTLAGRIVVESVIEGERPDPLYRFVWREVGGPEVVAPKHAGFGSVLLEAAPQKFADNVRSDFRPTGLVFEIEARLSRIADV